MRVSRGWNTRDHALLTAVLGVVMRAVVGFQRGRARRLHGVAGRCGSVTVVQRFGSALNLNVHLHAIVLDGVHVEDSDGRLRFQALIPPAPSERLALTETIAVRVRRLLGREGRLAGEEWTGGDEASSALASCQAASVRNVVAFGPRAGEPLRKIVLPAVASSVPGTHEGRGVAGCSAASPRRASRVARRRGRGGAGSDRCSGSPAHDLDIGPVILASDRRRLERLCRYALRPPIATDRLEELPDGRLKYAFRHPWRDGTAAVVMEPLDFLARLAALVPAPGRHVLRYHGTLAPNSRWRRRIVPVVAAVAPPVAGPGPAGGGDAAPSRAASARAARLSWAELMLRVFRVDVLECPRCQGRLKIVATVTKTAAVQAILECLGLPARPPPLAPAREREQAEFGFEG